MKIPRSVLLKKGLEDFLVKRNLDKQYRKAKNLFLSGDIYAVDLRIRQPKSDLIYYFKINKQYRAWGYYNGDEFLVFKIDDHQD